jgi:hypothetical protein
VGFLLPRWEAIFSTCLPTQIALFIASRITLFDFSKRNPLTLCSELNEIKTKNKGAI